MQVPAVTPVTVDPLIVHTLGVWDAKVTGLPEPPPVADTEQVPFTTQLEGAGPKVMVWVAGAMEKLCVT